MEFGYLDKVLWVLNIFLYKQVSIIHVSIIESYSWMPYIEQLPFSFSSHLSELLSVPKRTDWVFSPFLPICGMCAKAQSEDKKIDSKRRMERGKGPRWGIICNPKHQNTSSYLMFQKTYIYFFDMCFHPVSQRCCIFLHSTTLLDPKYWALTASIS